MAYQDALSPAQLLSSEITMARNFFDAIGRFLTSFAGSMSMAAIARARFETLTALQGKSDAELAQLNLRREDLVRHVFHDLYYS